MSSQNFLFAVASEAELNDLASGNARGAPQRWPFPGSRPRLPSGSFGVLWEEPSDSMQPVRPAAIVSDAAEHRRFFGRFSQVRSDLSPVSTWCHVFTPGLFEALDSPVRRADLNGLEAAWAGLAIAEAAILSERPISQVKVAACLATQSYAVGRTLALWPRAAIGEVLNTYEVLQRDVRLGGGGLERIRQAFEQIWASLAAASMGDFPLSRGGQIVSAIAALQRARERDLNEQVLLREALSELPEASVLNFLADLSPEQRLNEFDKLARAAIEARTEPLRRQQLSFLSGYIATVAAGGSASLGLAEDISQALPEVAGWAYVIGGIGERVTWTSGFGGLGRLVARELSRPFNVGEAPVVDFAADEARVLVDKALADPLVHLQLKQSRVATVALYPGVNIQVPFAEPPQEVRHTQERRANNPTRANSRATDDPWAVIAEALLPYLTERLAQDRDHSAKAKNTKARYARKPPQRTLPLDD